MITHRLAAIYARVSSEEQAQTSGIPSTETQIEKCQERAASLGIPVATRDSGLIVEETHSGTDLRWAGSKFMELVRRAQYREFTDLICLDVDRFCRSGPAALFEQMAYFQDAGVAIHWVLLSVPEDMPFHGTIMAANAEGAKYWRDKIVEASTRVTTAYAAAGNLIAGNAPPFGWEFVEDPMRLSRRNRPIKIGLRPHPHTSPVLLRMYEHVAAGGTIKALCDWLEAQGVLTPRGAPVWHEATVRRILHNETNWGERRSFRTVRTPHPKGVRRSASERSIKLRVRVPVENQYTVDPSVIERIPGLTRDLAMRALSRLAENQEAQSVALAKVNDTERSSRGLLFGGMVRCGVCHRGLWLKKHKNGWLYCCYHLGTALENETCVSMVTRKLDPVVWRTAVAAVKDPAFFERMLSATDQIASPEARIRALSKQLQDGERSRANLQKHLRRLDPDDEENVELIRSIEEDLRAVSAEVAEARKALEAVEAERRTEEARQATLAAFRDYAASERPTIDQKTPLEKHQLLRAMGVKVRLAGGKVSYLDRVWIIFDLRSLPGAAQYLRDGARRVHHILDLGAEDGDLGAYVYEVQADAQDMVERPRSGRSTANTSVATPSSKGFTLS